MVLRSSTRFVLNVFALPQEFSKKSFFQGTTFPALNAMLAQWAPIGERGRMGSLVFGGAQIGNIAGTYLSGLVMKNTGDWQPVFYLFGALALLWFILWVSFPK